MSKRVASYGSRISAVLLPFILAACGGEESDVVPDPDMPPPFGVDPAIFSVGFVENFSAFETMAQSLINDDARYSIQDISDYFDFWYDIIELTDPPVVASNPLRSAGVHYAHAAGLTGAGQIIAFSDEGFLVSHEVFGGKTITTGDDLLVDDHGTAVASVAAGSSDNMIGVAPGADLIFGSYETDAQLTQTAETALAMGAVALNNSWGYDLSATRQNFNDVFSTPDGADYLAALTDYAAEGVVVFAIDNNEMQTRTDLMGGLPLLRPGLEPGWLAVINGLPVLDDTNDIVEAYRVSAPCAGAARWCLAADGAWYAAGSLSDDDYYDTIGSSFAAPMVSGALALLAQAFPDLTPHDLRMRLLASADNDFAEFDASASVEFFPGFEKDISSEWGHGFLDVKAALLPIGAPVIPLSNGQAHSVSRPLAVDGGVTGDAISRGLAGLSVTARDQLGGTFDLPADRLVTSRSAPRLFANRRADVTRVDIALESDTLAAYGSAVAVPLPNSELELTYVVPDSDAAPQIYGLGLRSMIETDHGKLTWDLSLGQDDGVLMPGAFGQSENQMIGAAIRYEVPLDTTAALEFGASVNTLSSRSGPSAQAVLTSASLSHVTRDAVRRGDRLTLSVSMPMAVAQGSMDLPLPVSRDGFSASAVEVDLAPLHREVRLGFDYEVDLGRGTSTLVSLHHSANRGHIEGARETALFLGLKAEF